MPHGLTSEQKSALKAFADRNGRSWKSRLCDLWMNGRDWREPEASLLRQIRNAIGSAGLHALTKADLR